MLNVQELIERTEGSLKAYAGVSRGHEVEEFVTVFANEGFSMVAGHVVPFDSVVVEVVQN